MHKKKIPSIEITAICTFLLLLITAIVFRDELSDFLGLIVNLFIKILDILLLILLFKIPIYLLLLLIILFLLIGITIKKIKRRNFVDVRDSILFQIFQLGEIGEKSLIYEYIELLESGFGYKINNEILPKDKELEFKNIIADLLKCKLIISKAETRDKGKLYKLTDKGRKYARRKKWKVL